MKNLLKLYLTFVKIGAFMFGGGYSMLPLLERELVERLGWTSEEELLDYFAIAQCTPGVIAVNTATFIGQKRGGFWGGAMATLGVITVPLLLVIVIVSALMRFWHLPAVTNAFDGIRVAVAALIAAAVVRLARSNVKNLFGIVLCVLGFVAVAVLGQSPIVVVAGAALAGLVAGRIRR
ncbi:MAG TPA: chromate transporter [Eubacteriales bacterium]|nr:chromate transporter [Eubacteriales bacterium]